MDPSLREIYLNGIYPVMSHPSADPLIHWLEARRCGVEAINPRASNILEIGCGTGFHLTSLANRWPESTFVGIDSSTVSIRQAEARAKRVGFKNLRFIPAAIEDLEPQNTKYDYIIVHGLFSWVSDEVKLAVMDFLGKNLAANGIGNLSFNVVAGWRERMKVVEKARAVAAAGNVNEMTALAVLNDALQGTEKLIVKDMLAKGPQILAFDDFAPIMDPWSFGAVRKLAEASGLKSLRIDPDQQDRIDEQNKQTFRSELFCRAEVLTGVGEELKIQETASRKISNFPKLDAWRLLCARDALPLPDQDLHPCHFTLDQQKLLVAMDGTMSIAKLLEYAKEHVPNLDLAAFLKELDQRGLLAGSL